MNFGNDKAWAICDGLKQARQLEGVLNVLFTRVEGGFLHPLQVPTCTKAFAFPAQHDRTKGLGPVLEHICESGNQLVIERISGLWSVQRNMQYRSILFDDQHPASITFEPYCFRWSGKAV